VALEAPDDLEGVLVEVVLGEVALDELGAVLVLAQYGVEERQAVRPVLALVVVSSVLVGFGHGNLFVVGARVWRSPAGGGVPWAGVGEVPAPASAEADAGAAGDRSPRGRGAVLRWRPDYHAASPEDRKSRQRARRASRQWCRYRCRPRVSPARQKRMAASVRRFRR